MHTNQPQRVCKVANAQKRQRVVFAHVVNLKYIYFYFSNKRRSQTKISPRVEIIEACEEDNLGCSRQNTTLNQSETGEDRSTSSERMTMVKVEEEPRAPVEGGCGVGGEEIGGNGTVHGSIAGSVAGEGAEKETHEARYVVLFGIVEID